MKKIDLILNGKIDAKLTETKKAKITKAIEVAILNAEDDLLGKELEYEKAMSDLGCCTTYDVVLNRMVIAKQDIEDLERFIVTLKGVQADLDEEVSCDEVEVKA